MTKPRRIFDWKIGRNVDRSDAVAETKPKKPSKKKKPNTQRRTR